MWDCNCFHNSGYIMGKYALDTAIQLAGGGNPPVLVINIDQHSDAGKSGQTVVSSDRWGNTLIDCYPNSAFLSVASGGIEEGAYQIETHSRVGGGPVNKVLPMHLPRDRNLKLTVTDVGTLFGNEVG